ncbi:ATP-binding cassette sub-family D member 4 [Smittium culicis]|uniref:ATP-binding cassette sub-family D member 4 n=1 Tax=Smittium culicis TaxID=133412 RepID=A0A1R1XIW3_9FUNG|nr:ATP-binding cassette sub-family D member 4 [Smittium culicis]
MSGHNSKKDSVPQSDASSNSLNSNTARNEQTSKTAGPHVLPSYGGMQSNQFNIKFGDIGKLYKVISISLSSKEKGVATEGLSLGIIPISILLFLGFIAGEFVAYFVGLVPSDFYLSLVGVDKKLFDKTMLKSAFLVLLSAVLVAVNNLFSGIVQAKSRLSLSSYTQNIYIKKHTLNKLVLEKKIDNPDQRITQDIDKLSASFMRVISQIFISPVLVVYYSVRTWKITGRHTFKAPTSNDFIKSVLPRKSRRILQSSFISMYLIFTFTTILSTARDFADIVGFAARITSMWDELDKLNNDSEPDWIRRSDNDDIDIVGLSVATPTGAGLISNLNLHINKGENLIITGKNGSGKTSLLRVLNGIWRPTSGYVSVPFENGEPEVIFLPQRPYLVYGTLRDQILYPYISNGADIDQGK